MAIEIVDFPIETWYFVHSYVNVYQRVMWQTQGHAPSQKVGLWAARVSQSQ